MLSTVSSFQVPSMGQWSSGVYISNETPGPGMVSAASPGTRDIAILAKPGGAKFFEELCTTQPMGPEEIAQPGQTQKQGAWMRHRCQWLCRAKWGRRDSVGGAGAGSDAY